MSFKFSAQSAFGNRSFSNGSWSGDGFDIETVTEDIAGETEWSIVRDRTSLIVHLGGKIDKIETEFDGHGWRLEPPMPGELWLVPPGVTYSTRVKGSSAKYVELTYDAGVFSSVSQAPTLAMVAGGFDHFLLQKVNEAAALRKTSDDVAALCLFETVSAVVDRINAVHSTMPEPKTKRAIFFDTKEKAMVESYIQDNLSVPVLLSDLSELVNETPHRFLWAFRNAFASTPTQFILDQRLRLARRLLQTTLKDITTVAMETGFANHSHLTTAFRKRTGLTPSQFRAIAN